MTLAAGPVAAKPAEPSGPTVIVDPETLDAARTLLTLKQWPNTTQYQWTHDDRQTTGNAVQ